MKRLIVGECHADHLFQMSDPDSLEIDFEANVVKALSCAFPSYRCIVFGGSFQYDLRTSKPDLALIAKDLSHWFIIEVEMVHHSLFGHVIPQVQAFQFGKAQADCSKIIARELNLPLEQARTLVEHHPKSVVVISNRRVSKWETSLKALNVQLISISVFKSHLGVEAFEIDGSLEVRSECIGWGRYSATDRSIRFHKSVKLSLGNAQFIDQNGVPTNWIVSQSGETFWVTKEVGWPTIEDGVYVLLTRSYDGRISLKIPSA
jgi:hypothetical protein